jgi:hypothetical protein
MKHNKRPSTPLQYHKHINDNTKKDVCKTPNINKELSSDINKTSGLKQHRKIKSQYNEPDKIVTQLNFKDININEPNKYNLTE